MNTILKIIESNKIEFSEDFINWIPNNIHVFEAFSQEAFKVIKKGFNHYSAKTIIHVLRHHSAVAENESEWKINNNYSPYLARLFDLVYPKQSGLFEYRTIRKSNMDTYYKICKAWENHYAKK